MGRTGRRLRVRRASTAVGLGSAAALLLAGCSSSPAPPDGFIRVEQGYLAVHVPEDWIDSPEQAAGRFDIVREDDAESPTHQLAMSTEYTTEKIGYGARAALLGVRDVHRPVSGVDEPPGEVVDVRVDDQDRAVARWEFTYDDGAYEGVAWAADSKGDSDDQETVVVILTGKDLDDEIVNEIERSIEALDRPVPAAAEN